MTSPACRKRTEKNDTIQDIKREWKGKIFYRIGTSRSNGQLILIERKLVYEEVKLVKETDRIIIIQIIINDTKHTVINFYAPNIIAEKNTISTPVKR